MTDNTIFDSVFKTMLQKSPQLLVPLVNEVFGRDYAPDAPVELFSNEHESLQGTIVADSVFRLQNKLYHVECQSTADSAMVIRMIEYDFAIALEEALVSGAPYRMEFPSSCVLFLRHTNKTPDVLEIEVVLPDGATFTYETKVMKAQSFSIDDIFNRQLLLLLPFYLMRYEEKFSRIAADDAETCRLVAECAALRAELEKTMLATGDTLLYEELTELIIRVSDYLMRAHEALRKKVRAAMGGEVLELLHDRAERLEREAREQGLAEGRKQGIEQGIEQGIGQGVEQATLRGIASLMKSMGLSAEQAMEALEVPDKDRQRFLSML